MTQTSIEQFEHYLLDSKVSKNMYNWPSTIGKCRRELAYAYHGFQALPITLQKAKAFLEGKGIHKALTADLIRSQLYKYREHPKFQWKVEDKILMPVEVDGIIEYLGRTMVFEAKSASAYQFSKMMISSDISNQYYMQVQIYMTALDIDFTLVFLWNKGYDPKETGVKGKLLGKLIINKEPDILDKVLAIQKTVKESVPDNLPDRDISLQANGKLRFECLSCRFPQHCYPKEYEKQQQETLNAPL